MSGWILILTFLIAGFEAQAAKPKNNVFTIEMDVHVDGRLVASPRLLAPPNTKAAITQSTKHTKEKVYVAIHTKRAPNPRMPDALLMSFAVVYTKGKSRKIASKPQILALPGERAVISISDEQHPEALKLSVIARAPSQKQD